MSWFADVWLSNAHDWNWCSSGITDGIPKGSARYIRRYSASFVFFRVTNLLIFRHGLDCRRLGLPSWMGWNVEIPCTMGWFIGMVSPVPTQLAEPRPFSSPMLGLPDLDSPTRKILPKVAPTGTVGPLPCPLIWDQDLDYLPILKIYSTIPSMSILFFNQDLVFWHYMMLFSVSVVSNKAAKVVSNLRTQPSIRQIRT